VAWRCKAVQGGVRQGDARYGGVWFGTARFGKDSGPTGEAVRFSTVLLMRPGTAWYGTARRCTVGLGQARQGKVFIFHFHKGFRT